MTHQWLGAKGISRDRLHRLLQDHHVVGEAHDSDLIVTLCLNCHREITEGLAAEGVSMHPQGNLLKLIALMLVGSAVLFESLAASYRKWAALLDNYLRT